MKFAIGGRMIGDHEPCFIVAEAGVNHNGSVERALRMVKVAKASGADAIKFQTFLPEALATPRTPLARYQRKTTGRARDQLDLLRRLALDEAQHREIHRACRAKGIQFLSTPFDDASAQFLADLGVPAFKVASGDLTNLPFLELVASFRRPTIISTGMGTMKEVARAINTIRTAGEHRIVALQCTTAYPESAEDANLLVIPAFRKELRSLVGFSDHTVGLFAAVAAVALRACVVEKHFTLSRTLKGPDHRASLEPDELRTFVRLIRETEKALGDGRKRPMPGEQENLVAARKSIVARVAIPAGAKIVAPMLTAKRPGSGITPSDQDRLVGRIARVDIPANALLSWRHVR